MFHHFLIFDQIHLHQIQPDCCHDCEFGLAGQLFKINILKLKAKIWHENVIHYFDFDYGTEI